MIFVCSRFVIVSNRRMRITKIDRNCLFNEFYISKLTHNYERFDIISIVRNNIKSFIDIISTLRLDKFSYDRILKFAA